MTALNKGYKYLTTCTLTINATPENSIVSAEGIYPYGTEVVYKVESQGYLTKAGTVTLLEDTTREVDLIKGLNHEKDFSGIIAHSNVYSSCFC